MKKTEEMMIKEAYEFKSSELSKSSKSSKRKQNMDHLDRPDHPEVDKNNDIEQMQPHPSLPFEDMDSEYQYIDFDEADKTPLKTDERNPWVDEIPNDSPESDRLRKEIEEILKEAEEAKRAAEMQHLLKLTEPSSRLDKETEETQEAEEPKRAAEAQQITEPSSKVDSIDDDDIRKDDGKYDGKDDEAEKLLDEPAAVAEDGATVENVEHVAPQDPAEEQSTWKKVLSSEPVTVVTHVAKEVILAVSMFSMVSYLTLQFLDMQ